MTKNPITIPGKTPIFKIEQIFRQQKIWSLVIEDSGKFIGIVTKSDLKYRGRHKSPKTPAFAIMTRNMITIEPDNDVEYAISLILKKNINGLPVVKNGRIYGIITRYDIKKKYPMPDKTGGNGNQTKPRGQRGFIGRLKDDINAIFIKFIIYPLKVSYHNDTIKFLALIALYVGLIGFCIIGIGSFFWILFFQNGVVPEGKQPPIELFMMFFGFFAIILFIGVMILMQKRQRLQSKIKPHPPLGETHLNDSISSHKFEIALSFSGQYRDLVEDIAFGLIEELGNNTVFYDSFYKAHLAQPNLDLLLQKIYKDNSRLNVIFLSSDYEDKEWCGIEFRAIRELIKTGHASNIMLLKLGDVNVKGLFSIDGYLDVQNMAALEISNHILDRVSGLK
jgi:hypothetical protein